MKNIEAAVDERFMRMALSLARRGFGGAGRVSPNPLVGCVITDGGSAGGSRRVLAFGCHKTYGGPHAEVEALSKASSAARGKTVYVNLEPCCHTGKTPPCCDALIRAGVGRVVVGSLDPNPLVAGGGVAALREAGIEVLTGVLEAESKWLNRGFFRRVAMHRPWVTIKAAISLDGNIALANGESKWISNEASRVRAHMLRAESDAVMVGIGTVMRDDPSLTVRDAAGCDPLRAVVDRDLSIEPAARVLADGRCVIFTGPEADERRESELRSRGARLIRAELDEDGRLPVRFMLGALAELGVNRLLVEGGAGLIGSFLKAGIADEFSLFIAPKLMGCGLSLAGSTTFRHFDKFDKMDEVITMKSVSTRMLGEDIWYEGIPSCSPDL